jgi:hypothetical protein
MKALPSSDLAVATLVAPRHTPAPVPPLYPPHETFRLERPTFCRALSIRTISRSLLQMLGHIGKHQLLDVCDSYGLTILEFDYCLAVMGM